MRALLCLLGLLIALPAYAGHGTIEETDECFVVQWSGDASDNATDAKQKVQPAPVAAPVAAAVAVKQQVAAVPEGVESQRPAPPPPGDDSRLRRSRRLRSAIVE
jgi:hypothetical protein